MKKYEHLIHYGMCVPLKGLTHHQNSSGIERIAWHNFPFHVASHKVDKISKMPQRYAQMHCHKHIEANIIVPNDRLVYEIFLGEERYVVEGYTAIWIPPGLLHAANVIQGSGFFICLIFDQNQEIQCDVNAL